MITSQISYSELAKRVGDMILANNLPNEVDGNWFEGIIQQPLMDLRLEELDKENELTDEQREQGEGASVTDFEIYQTYIITPRGAEYLFNHTAELISYSEKLDLWFWHIGHWGTSWGGVYTTVYTDDNYDTYVENPAMLRYTIA